MAENKVYTREIIEAFNILSEAGKAPGLKEKVALLKAGSGNHVLKDLLYYTFNSFLQYYVKQLPDVRPCFVTRMEHNYGEFIGLLDALSQRSVHSPKAAVAAFLEKCSDIEQTWYRKVIARNLEIGITAKGVNQAFPGLIPIYEVQLAESVKDVTLTDAKQLARLPEAFVLQYKIDGYRMNVHKFEDGHVDIRTRSGLPVTGYDRLEEEARAWLPAGMVYDGEVVSPELFSWIEGNMLSDSGTKIADRSLFTEAMRKCFSRETGKDGIFNIFDAVSLSEWRSQASKDDYSARLDFLRHGVDPVIEANRLTQMTVVPTSRVFYKNNAADMAEVVRIFHKFLSWGWEGLMIKSIESPYEWKRTKNLMKMKLMDTVDLTVLSVIEAEGQGRGQVGKLVCSYKGAELNIGTGKMTADEKRLYFENPNRIIGKTIEVAYQAESIGRNGEPVLDFARYMKLRKDK